ncbi:hypothetical protein CPB86DRAFT_772098 [Serendipita vermifera]|nr:hypothetical protein CPB86DRAFT_772098 [Serendipita vermifera]
MFMIVYIFFAFCILLAIYYTREAIIERLPSPIRNLFPASVRDYTLLPTTFEEQAAQGYSTSAFDLEANLQGDSRVGLDDQQLREIQRIMRTERVNFDEARLIRQKREMIKNGIDPATGMPIDGKAITRL